MPNGYVIKMRLDCRPGEERFYGAMPSVSQDDILTWENKWFRTLNEASHYPYPSKHHAQKDGIRNLPHGYGLSFVVLPAIDLAN
jgi:hypothetical protein